tara:strand:+ start:573 stop:770 length:198 start_codon:yes stop_codon:yes gene_type:complete
MTAELNKKAQVYYVGNGSGETTTETNVERNPLSNVNYIKKVDKLPSDTAKTKDGILGNATSNTGG